MTRMVDGSVHVGPNAVLALGREAYEGGIDRRDALALAREPGLRRLAARYWRTGAAELLRSRSERLLLADVRRLLPDATAEDLRPSGAGIRAQALGRDGTLLDDFAFATSPRAVHVLNAPSPAATASLAIADVVADRLDQLVDAT
jgi:L-2-hydroxyglutarate oxidase